MNYLARRGAIAALLLLAGLPAAATMPVTDLSRPVSLAGQWKFQPGDDPGWAAPDLDDRDWQTAEVPARFPAGHAGYSGMLWYRLALDLDLSQDSVRQAADELAVTIGNVMSAYELYAGGTLIGSAGSLPPSPEARYDRRATWPIPESAIGADGRLVFGLRVWRNPAIGDHWETGPYFGDFMLGEHAELRADLLLNALLPNVLLAVVYLVLGLYHLLIARRNPALKEFFWFGLFSIVLAGYTFETSQSKFFVDIPYLWHKTAEHLLLYLSPILFGKTLLAVTRTPANRLVTGFHLVFGLFFLAVLLVPGDAVLSQTLRPFQYLAAAWALAMTAIMAKRAYDGSRAARAIVALLLLLVGAVVNDLFLEKALVGSGNILYIVFALLLFFMALMMAERYTEILRKLESSVERRTAELVRANRDLAAAAETKGNFLANMSHEMRTPMNAILGLTRLGLQTELTEQQRDYFGKVEQSAEGLQDIIDSILDFSKLEDGELRCVSEPFRPAALVGEIRRIWEEPAREAGLELEIRAAADLPETLVGDMKRLKQVLGNFISNAVKFTEEGRVSLSLALLQANETSARIRFTVADTGVGIPEDKRRHLFEAFSQADNSMTRQYGGTGLGLSIAERLVELMGGTIEVESTPGKGSTFGFELTLPLADPASEADGDAAELDLSPIRGARVLVVDDSELNLQVAGELLRKAGLYVDTAMDGRQAIEKVSSAQYDCVLMDVQMPVMDGYTATERIRAKPHFSDLPILAMTANAMQQDRERGAAAGMNAYIPKPVEPDELYAALLRWIEPGVRLFRDERPAAPDSGDEARPDLPDALPGIRVDEGLKRVAGNASLYLDLLEGLCKDYADAPRRIEDMLAGGDTEGAGQFAHKLRGIANNLGADETGAAAEAIETALKSGVAVTQEALERLRAGLARAAESQASLAPLAAGGGASEALSEGQRQALFGEACQAVSENNPEAQEMVETLLAGMEESGAGYAELSAASTALDMYDFAAASEYLTAAAGTGTFANPDR